MASVFWIRARELFPDIAVRTIRRIHAGDIEQIATPRQLVAGLMRWATRGPNRAAMPGDVMAEASAWPSLYQWFATVNGYNASIDHLRDRAWRALSYCNDAKLSPEIGRALFNSCLSLGTAQIETMAACPFKHFVRYGLCLQQRERPDVGLGDLGQVYHRLLETLINAVIGQHPERYAESLDITQDQIHAAAVQVAKALRGEVMLSSARNRYLLKRVEKTLGEVLASQQAVMNRSKFRPSGAGVPFVPGGPLPPLKLTTTGGEEISVRGHIDRIDTVPETGHATAVIFDYRMGSESLSLQYVYHGLSLQLLTFLLVLEQGGEQFRGRPLTPMGAFYIPLLRGLEMVEHPDDAPDPRGEKYLLQVQPRGVFDSRALPDLDNALEKGRSSVVSAYINVNGMPGNLGTTDIATPAEFKALMSHVRGEIVRTVDRIVAGEIAIAPYRIARKSPCPHCEYRGVCRFETTVNRYHHLMAMDRQDVLRTLREGAANG